MDGWIGSVDPCHGYGVVRWWGGGDMHVPALLEELRDELDVEDRELPDVVLCVCVEGEVVWSDSKGQPSCVISPRPI